MINTNALFDKFDCITEIEGKIIVNDKLVSILNFLKEAPEYNFDMLTSMIAVDLGDKIEILYQLYSTSSNSKLNIYYTCLNNSAPSVIGCYKSAYFDECEIFDMFGINFVGNDSLKRLFMPKSWVGNPMLKSYKLCDERLAWND